MAFGTSLWHDLILCPWLRVVILCFTILKSRHPVLGVFQPGEARLWVLPANLVFQSALSSLFSRFLVDSCWWSCVQRNGCWPPFVIGKKLGGGLSVSGEGRAWGSHWDSPSPQHLNSSMTFPCPFLKNSKAASQSKCNLLLLRALWDVPCL